MPVQFVCSHCRRMLSVAHRKAGQTVACPKCGQPTLVPSPLPEPAHATATAEPKTAPSLVAEPGAFDDIPVLISETASATPLVAAPGTSVPIVAPLVVPAPATPPPPAVADPPPWASAVAAPETAIGNVVPPVTSRAAAIRRARQTDGTVLLVTRKAVYAQAGLIGGLVLLAFLAGLVMGRGSRPAAKTSPGGKTAAAEPVALEGHVLYSFSPGESSPDEGATVIALPVDKKPDHKIAARGLRPDDADDLEAAPAAEELRALGAAVARTDRGGQFQLVVSQPGDYSLLIVSHHATRPEGQTIALADQKELAGYFASPSDLIGQKRYTISARRLSGAPPALTHEFGPTD